MTRGTVAAVVVVVLAWPWLAAAAPPSHAHGAEVRAERPGKPTGPIAVEYRLAGDPAIGVPLEIAVMARVDAEIGVLRIEAGASSPGAALVAPPLLTSVVDGVYSWALTVVPLADDAGYVSVIVAGNVDGVAQARNVTISLRSAPAQGSVPAVRAVGGETRIALPVQESP
jgi:hypothetical protein